MDSYEVKDFQAGEYPQPLTTKPRPQSRVRTLFKLTAFVGLVFLLYPSLRPLAPKRLFSGHGCHRGISSLKSSGLPTHYTLPSGDKIPSVQLGVWKSAPNEVGTAIKAALESGYEGIDDAWIYRNENEVGDALKENEVARSDIWITSKLWNAFHAPEDVESAIGLTLAALQTDYVDLYLMHWPVAFKKDQTGPDGKPVVDYELTADPYPTWKAMEALVDKGKAKNIGVSNFNMHRLENLTANPLKYQPAVNQVEINFWNPQPELLKWSQERNLLLEAYSPLGSDQQVKQSLSVPEVKKAAAELGLTPAQIIISWIVQRGIVVLPKSVHANRVAENIGVKKLPQETFDAIEAAASAHEPLRVVNPSKGWGLKFDVFDETV